MVDSYNLSDVFISYSRRDTEFVRRLDEAFKQAKREVWVDWEDIPATADWWQEIRAGIEGADTFIFIITPDSVASEICFNEIQHAIDNNKRFIPVLHREIEDEALQAQIHPAISTHNWIFFRDSDDFHKSMQQLLAAIEADLSHVRTHTRYLVRAQEWISRDRAGSFLLSGGEVQEAETWMTRAGSKEPRPTELHTEYILASRNARNSRQRRILAGVSIAFVIALVLSILSLFLANRAATSEAQALSRGTEVANQAAIAENNAATATIAQGQALVEANNAGTQAALAENNAATATIAQGQALVEANNAATQAAVAQIAATAEANARATSSYNEQIAQTQAAAATIAQGQALVEADRAATQANIAENNAATATIAQGQALVEANNAATQAAVAQIAATAEANARATSSRNELRAQTQAAIAQQNAATATIAQGQALVEADRAATQAAIAQDSAATATIAQGIAIIEANRAGTQAAIATIAQGRAQNQAATAEARGTEVAVKAATATVAQGQAEVEANNAATQAAIAEASEREARAQALAVRAEQALNFGDTNVALALALESARLNPELLQTQSVLNRIVAVSPLLMVRDVHAGIFSPDGDSLLTLNIDQTTLELWDIAERRSVFRITGHTDIIHDFTFSPDGQLILSVAADGQVGLWQATTGENVDMIDDHGTAVEHLLLHPDNERFITAGADGGIFLRDIATGARLTEFRSTTAGSLAHIRFNATGRALYAWSAEPPIVMSRWDVEQEIMLPRQLEQFVHFARNGQYRIRVNGESLAIHATDGDGLVLQLPTDITDVIDFTPDGTALLVRTQGGGGRFDIDQRLTLLDRATGDIIRTFSGSGVSTSNSSTGQTMLLNNRSTASNVREARILSDGNTVISVLPDNRVILWDLRDGRLLRVIGVSDLDLSVRDISYDNRFALTLGEDHIARVHDMTGLQSTAIINRQERRDITQQIIASWRETGGLYGALYSVSWNGLISPDQRFWLAVQDVFNLRLRNLETETDVVIENTLDNAESTIRAFNASSEYVITGFRDGKIRIWDIQAAGWRWNWLQADDADNLEEIRFTSNPQQFVALYDRVAILWDIDSGETIQRYSAPDMVSPLTRYERPDDPTFYTWFYHETHNRILNDSTQLARIMLNENRNTANLLIWNLEDGQLLRQIDLMQGTAPNKYVGARFTPNGASYIRIGQIDDSIEMFDVISGEKIRRFFGHTDPVNGLGFSPNGEKLVSSSISGELLLWDITTGQLVRTLNPASSTLEDPGTSNHIVFTQDGRAAAYFKTQLPTLDMPVIRIETLTDAVAWTIQNRQIPELTCGEREQYNVLPLCQSTGEVIIPTPTMGVTPTSSPSPTITPTFTATPQPTATAFPVGTIQSNANVILRGGPGQEYRSLANIPPGTIVEIISESNGWLQIRLRDNNEGWVLETVVRR